MNQNQLKLLACGSMLIDHFGVVFFPEVLFFRILGRLAFLLFSWQLAQSWHFTKNRPCFLATLLFFGLLSQLPFSLVFPNDINILLYFVLVLGWLFSYDQWQLGGWRRRIPAFLLGGGLLFFVTYYSISYSFYGFGLTLIYYHWREQLKKTVRPVVFLTLFTFIVAFRDFWLQFFMLFWLPALLLANQKQGQRKYKYFFYFFYPVHLALLVAVKILLG